MKPLHVAVLVVVSAVIGGMFMKWQISRNMARVAVVAPAATAAQPAAIQPVATASQPAEPLPAPEPKTPKVSAKPHLAPKSHRAATVMTARSQEPVVKMPPAEPVQPQPAPAVAPPAPLPVKQPQQPVQQPEPAAPTPAPVQPAAPLQVTLKAGMLIPVRTGESLSSAHNSPGDGFSATLDQPLAADGWVIAERGARMEGKVFETGRGNLVLVLTRLRTSDGQHVPIETETFSKEGQASTGESAAKVAAGTAIGAAIGAMAAGGRGAAIGAAAGTVAGAGGAVATRSKNVVLPAETLIRFRLKKTVTITERQGQN